MLCVEQSPIGGCIAVHFKLPSRARMRKQNTVILMRTGYFLSIGVTAEIRRGQSLPLHKKLVLTVPLCLLIDLALLSGVLQRSVAETLSDAWRAGAKPPCF